LGFDDASTLLAIADDQVLHLLNLSRREQVDIAFSRIGGVAGSTQWLAFAPDGSIDSSAQALTLLRYEREGGVPVALQDATQLFADDPYHPDLLEKFLRLGAER